MVETNNSNENSTQTSTPTDVIEVILEKLRAAANNKHFAVSIQKLMYQSAELILKLTAEVVLYKERCDKWLSENLGLRNQLAQADSKIGELQSHIEQAQDGVSHWRTYYHIERSSRDAAEQSAAVARRDAESYKKENESLSLQCGEANKRSTEYLDMLERVTEERESLLKERAVLLEQLRIEESAVRSLNSKLDSITYKSELNDELYVESIDKGLEYKRSFEQARDALAVQIAENQRLTRIGDSKLDSLQYRFNALRDDRDKLNQLLCDVCDERDRYINRAAQLEQRIAAIREIAK